MLSVLAGIKFYQEGSSTHNTVLSVLAGIKFYQEGSSTHNPVHGALAGTKFCFSRSTTERRDSHNAVIGAPWRCWVVLFIFLFFQIQFLSMGTYIYIHQAYA